MDFSILKNLFGKKDSHPENSVPDVTPVNEENSQEETPAQTPEEIGIAAGTEKPVVVEEKRCYSGSSLVVLLDNGHAKSTPGKRSPVLDDGRQFFEYEFNRDVVARIAAALKEEGIRHHILVPEVDKDVALTERANRANKWCKTYGTKNCLFISVHSNAYGNGKTWTEPGRWSVWTTVGVTKSDEMAKVFYNVAEEYLKPHGFSCRDGKVQGNGNSGPDYESNFTVLYKTWCPALLTENLFYTNKRECEWLMTDEGRQVIADIHVEAIKRIIDSL